MSRIDTHRTTCISDVIDIRRAPETGFDPEPDTLGNAMIRASKAWENQPALVSKEDVTYTFKQYYDNAMRFSKATRKHGAVKSSCVGIIGFNSPEYFFTLYGSWLLGAVSVGIYTTNAPEACHYVLNHSDSIICVCEGGKQAAKIYQIRDQLPNLKAIIVYWPDEGMPEDDGKGHAKVYSWEDFLKTGDDIADEEILSETANVEPGSCATLIYTSGTTGEPKGVMISHDSCVFQSLGIKQRIGLNGNDRYTSFLPLNHIAAQYVDAMVPVVNNVTVYICRPDALKGSLLMTLQKCRPTLSVAVPRLYEKMAEKVKANRDKASYIKGKIMDWAMRIGTQSCLSRQFNQESKRPAMYNIANKLVFQKVREGLGFDQARGLVVSAAPVSEETLRFFAQFDIPIFDLLGQSEGCAPFASNSYVDQLWKLGSGGPAMPGVVVKSGEQNELMYRGRNVMMGYLKLDEETRKTLDSDGWIHTGDQGHVDNDGFVYITGRLKELIVTSGGENVSPVPIENKIMEICSEISNVIVIGDKRNYLSCLICLKTEVDSVTGDPKEELSEKVIEKSKSIGSEAMTCEQAAGDEKWNTYIGTVIEKYNHDHAVSNAQNIRKWVVLKNDISLGKGELTATMKMKRMVVMRNYAAEIEGIYKENE